MFDGLVVPGGAAHVETLHKDGRAAEFLKDQCRHCKPIAVLAEAAALAEGAGVLRDKSDTGLVFEDAASPKVVATFIAALAAHRHFVREKEPPPV